MNVQNIAIPDEAIAALEAGNRVEAVRIIRDTAWVTLKQAGRAADAYLEANPEVKARFNDHNGKAWTGLVYFIALLASAAIIANLAVS
jgi:hypothetical protein